MKVSVIIPVYNAEEYLREGLQSVAGQTLKDIEVICVDDGSTDSSSKIIDEFVKKDARFINIRQENGGAGKARNTGLKVAQGEYLSFLDCDDFYEADMLEKMYLRAKETNARIVVCACDQYINETGEYTDCSYSIHQNLLPDNKDPFAGVDVPKDLFKLFVGWPWDKLFEAKFVKENNLLFQEQRTTNDMLFVFSAMAKADRMSIVYDILAHHRKTQGTLSVTREKSWMCFYQALLALRKQLSDWGLYSRFEQDFINYCVHASLWNLDTLAEPTHSMLKEKLKNEWLKELKVTGHTRGYFYNKHEYDRIQEVLGNTGKIKEETNTQKFFRNLKEEGLIKTMKKVIKKI